jgi:cell division protein ZapA
VGDSVIVNIFNQPYSLRSNHPESGEYVRQLARLVDDRMQQIASQMTSHDVAKIAVLAALNFADELSRLKEHQREDEKSETPAREPEADPHTWFDAIFDTSSSAQEKGERLSSQVAAKLKAIRSDTDDGGAGPSSGEPPNATSK